MNLLLFSFQETTLQESLLAHREIEKGQIEYRRFPDGESYIRLLSSVHGRHCVILETFLYPDDKVLRLAFLAKKLKEGGAKKITLLAPYLPYMRQDQDFQKGEVVTSVIFASLLSSLVDELVTVDPHLHRFHSLREIYSIPAIVLHATDVVAQWIGENLKNTVIIGPDSESEQWVSQVAAKAETEYTVMEKIRHGDRNVEIIFRDQKKFLNHIPVLVDDIISTANTMMETAIHLQKAGLQAPVCIGIHGIFAGNAYSALQQSGVSHIITTNSLPHATNAIDLSSLIFKFFDPDR